jgi:hypothetical protein
MANILRLAATALSHVPAPQVGVTANDYGHAIQSWVASTGWLKVYAGAANLALQVALLTEAEDDESKKFLAHLERQAAARAPKLGTDIVSGESREQKNERQKLIMRARRAAKKAAVEAAKAAVQ